MNEMSSTLWWLLEQHEDCKKRGLPHVARAYQVAAQAVREKLPPKDRPMMGPSVPDEELRGYSDNPTPGHP